MPIVLAFNDQQGSYMTRTLKDVELSERLRELIENRFGQRGRFRLLQEASEIPEWKWKNLFYRRQEAGQDQIHFWVTTYPDDEMWLLTGVHPPRRENYPFANDPPVARDASTIGDRLNWVVEEFASPRGEQLFAYLEGRYKRKVMAEAWKEVILRKTEPTLEMVALICSDRPIFAQWVLLGYASASSVDPTDQRSVERWTERQREQEESLMKTMQKNN